MTTEKVQPFADEVSVAVQKAAASVGGYGNRPAATPVVAGAMVSGLTVLASFVGPSMVVLNAKDAVDNVNDGSMVFAAMLVKHMANIQSNKYIGGVATSIDIEFTPEILGRALRDTERLLERSMDGLLAPDLLQVIRDDQRQFDDSGLSDDAKKALKLINGMMSNIRN